MSPRTTGHLRADVELQGHLLLLAESVKDEMSHLEFVEKRRLPNRERVYIYIPRRYRHRADKHSLHFYGYFEYHHGKRQLIIPLSKLLNQIAVEELHRLKSESKPSTPSTTPMRCRRRFPLNDVLGLEVKVKEQHLFEFPQHKDVVECKPAPSIDVPLVPSSISISKKRKMDDEFRQHEDVVRSNPTPSINVPLVPSSTSSSRKRKMDDEFPQHEDIVESELAPSIDVPLVPSSTSSSRKRKMDDDSSSSSSARKLCYTCTNIFSVPDDIPPRTE